ncbi:MAG: bifunctional UDP-N-acetylglucosamine diphosphorylase/glucosamine-1-phosphate N-acetyltransferase GlmU [Clostridia bacterium]|nr:bifunctional UDP-N-acetylglucosamine diphosphorylase/glucosamine-1-phosphate N-acetyltransferase GlmU [Clostridia bacterium]
MENLKAVILAAGEGTRMKSKKPKVLHEILNKTMIDYVIDTAKGCGAQEVCVVVGHKADEVKAAIKKDGVSFALQAEQKGTGHAVMMAGDFIDGDMDILILYGDTPLIQGDTLQKLVEKHRQENFGATVVSAAVENPAGYGRIIRDADGKFMKIVEHKDASEEERCIKEINTGIYIFKGADLIASLAKLDNCNVQGEYYLPDCLELILKGGGKVGAVTAEDEKEFFGVNSRVQLAEAANIMKARINRRHMENGVTLEDPQNTYIGADVKIGMDTVILPGCVLEGNTEIGEDCKIGPNSRLTDMRIGNGVAFQSSTGIESEIGNNTTVGPFAYIRPNCKIGSNVKIGDFVEVKNSTVGNGTKIPHLAYIGDTDAGEKVNFGCGSIMVNYDGQKKHRTVVEDHVFVGCNVNLVAPVTVKAGAYIAAGSTITRDVPEGVLAIARARQQVITGWKKKKIEKES